MKAEITYLFHSGFAVKTENHFLIFDYYRDRPKGGLAAGVVDPAEIAGEDVIVFSSHSHGDHYNPVIQKWRDGVKKIRYVLSDDIRANASADTIFVGPGKELDLGDVRIKTYKSNDLGVAFLLYIDDLCIYHAGDLNWWDWIGEPEEENRELVSIYKEEIAKMKGEKIDIAFVPLDGRLESNYLEGLDYFMREVGADYVLPMHFGRDFSVFEKLANEPRAAGYRDKVAVIEKRGQQFVFEKD